MTRHDDLVLSLNECDPILQRETRVAGWQNNLVTVC